VTEEANATVKVFDWSPNGSMLAQVKRGAPASLTWKTTDRPRTVDEKNNSKFYCHTCQACSQVLRFGGIGFCFYVMFKTNFSVHSRIYDNTK